MTTPPAGLTPEMLSEEDKVRLLYLKNAAGWRVTDLKRWLAADPNKSTKELINYYNKSIAWANNLLNPPSDDASRDTEDGA